jgi:hypothetical protein
VSATVDGATIGVLVDLGGATMILGRDHLGDVMNGIWESLTDLGCDVTAINWSWGATESLGPLTEVQAGGLSATLYDPGRLFDPANDASPYAALMRVGRAIRITVDGTPAWTGTIFDWAYSQAQHLVQLDGEDRIEQLSRTTVSVIAPAGTAASQIQTLMRLAGVPIEVVGSSVAARSSHAFRDSLLAGLMDARRAELGAAWIDHRGTVVFASRGWKRTMQERGLIGCGIPCMDVITYIQPGGVRNLVRIDRFDPAGTNLAPVVTRSAASIAKYGERSVIAAEEDLDLA